MRCKIIFYMEYGYFTLYKAIKCVSYRWSTPRLNFLSSVFGQCILLCCDGDFNWLGRVWGMGGFDRQHSTYRAEFFSWSIMKVAWPSGLRRWLQHQSLRGRGFVSHRCHCFYRCNLMISNFHPPCGNSSGSLFNGRKNGQIQSSWIKSTAQFLF
jgi:hypothetical protein